MGGGEPEGQLRTLDFGGEAFEFFARGKGGGGKKKEEKKKNKEIIAGQREKKQFKKLSLFGPASRGKGGRGKGKKKKEEKHGFKKLMGGGRRTNIKRGEKGEGIKIGQ